MLLGQSYVSTQSALEFGWSAFGVFRGDEVFDDAFEGVPRGGILDPGDSVTCVATHMLSQADVDRGRVVNTATAIGSTTAGQAVNSVSTAIYTALR